MIQEAINKAISAAGAAAAVAKGVKAVSSKGDKGTKAPSLADVSGAEAYGKAKEKASAISTVKESLSAESKGIGDKIAEQERILSSGELTPRQAGGHKGYITRISRAQARVEEKVKAAQYQEDLMRKRMEILKATHGQAWEALGIDPDRKEVRK